MFPFSSSPRVFFLPFFPRWTSFHERGNEEENFTFPCCQKAHNLSQYKRRHSPLWPSMREVIIDDCFSLISNESKEEKLLVQFASKNSSSLAVNVRWWCKKVGQSRKEEKKFCPNFFLMTQVVLEFGNYHSFSHSAYDKRPPSFRTFAAWLRFLWLGMGGITAARVIT